MSTTPKSRTLRNAVRSTTAHVWLARECTLGLSSCEVCGNLGSAIAHLNVPACCFELEWSSKVSAMRSRGEREGVT